MHRHVLTLSLVLFSSATLVAQGPPGLEKSKLKPREGTLKVGDAVPAFELRDLEGKHPVSRETLKGKPAVLIFGSCT